MPLDEARRYFGHMKNLIILNDNLYPDNDFYVFQRNSEIPSEPPLGLKSGPIPRLQRIWERQKKREERNKKK